MRPFRTLDSIRMDLAFAVRSLWRTPAFTLLAISVLALGIGANTAAFSLVNGVLLAPLPDPEPGRLISLAEVKESGGGARVSYPNFRGGFFSSS